jgi:DNA-binding CsgD family transcriptional regulator
MRGRKAGATKRRAAQRRGISGGELTVGGVRLVFLSAPLERPASLRQLTPAECEVARLAASGLSNAEIGRLRGASPRTIANQLASIFRKLEVGSRVELITRLAR